MCPRGHTSSLPSYAWELTFRGPVALRNACPGFFSRGFVTPTAYLMFSLKIFIDWMHSFAILSILIIEVVLMGFRLLHWGNHPWSFGTWGVCLQVQLKRSHGVQRFLMNLFLWDGISGKECDCFVSPPQPGMLINLADLLVRFLMVMAELKWESLVRFYLREEIASVDDVIDSEPADPRSSSFGRVSRALDRDAAHEHSFDTSCKAPQKNQILSS